jgi:4-hydroxy-3-polyprenylbenzoate decarboxylase
LHLALLVLDKQRPGEGAELARAAVEVDGVDIGVAVEGTARDPLGLLAWRALSSLDPRRDIQIHGSKLAVDATSKTPGEGHHRPWPAELRHPSEVREKATASAQALGLLT